ncbi:MAG: Hsp20/alpha crystallin family protein [Rhodospirillales bacterium]|nr:Hsp20/alpha crystallin family protein [Rhodospirillales bacterium]
MLFRDLIPGTRKNLPSDNRRLDPFHAMQMEMNRLFEDFWPDFEMPALASGNGGRAAVVAPRVDVSETEKEIQVTAELPGLQEKDVEVTFADGMLTIAGERKTEKEEKDEDKKYYVKERSYGSFKRMLALGEDVEEGKIKAEFKNGVLTVVLPKAKEVVAKTKRIPIGK